MHAHNHSHPHPDDEKLISATSSTSYIQQHYQSLINCTFQERPISRRQGDYDIEDPTVHVREKLIVFCQELVEAVKTRLEDAPSVFLLMKSCLDVSSLYEQVVLIGQQTLEDYGQSALQKLIDFTLLNSTDIQVKVTSIQQQYAEWKRRCLFEIVDKDTFGIWTTDGKIITSKVMKTFFYQQKASRWYS
ncbi:unnamed protein product [Rotaria socialis]|uniref:Uncharacterized protein n=1 Tax=Rotaria socialis TaxID=392032 RepID=A0A818H7V4_9BILA|nr:unnamed protein product [Rotaria socialis]CAF4640414.1 unnamed protein product [Rotaria socialis]